MPKKVLYIDGSVLTDLRMSGTGHVALHIARHLSTSKDFLNDYTIKLLVPFNKRREAMRHNFNKNIEIRPIWLPARVLNGLIRFNLLPPMDVFIGRGVYLFPNFKNWPLFFSQSITYIHDVAFRLFPEYIEPKNRSMLEMLAERFIRRTDTVVTVSKSSKAELLDQFSFLVPERVRVVENGVDRELFYARSTREIADLRRKYRLPEHYYMFLSNLEPRKNLSLLLDAYSQLSPEILARSALLIVGGMGWLNQGLHEKISSLNASGVRIVIPNQYVPDGEIPGLLSGAIALIHPAFHEGFGMSPLEALACETPVIVADIPVMREVVGKVGVYIEDLHDPKPLSLSMEKQYNRSYTKEQRRAFRNQALTHEWRVTLIELEKIVRMYR